MSRVRNSYEFLRRLRGISGAYDQLFRPRIDKIRNQFSRTPLGAVPPDVDESLEAHSRAYFVNGFLAALNWRLDVTPEDGLPNLIPEAPVSSSETGRRRFLDYLGFERGTTRPLLVVETKRPSAPLPRLAMPASAPSSRSPTSTGPGPRRSTASRSRISFASNGSLRPPTSSSSVPTASARP